MIRRWLWVAAVGSITAGVALASASRAAGGQAETSGDKFRPCRVVIIVANRLTLSDFTDPQLKLPNVSRLINEGAVGLLSPNCEHPRSENAVLMTASAGYRCPGGEFVAEFYDSDETIPQTGETAAAAFRICTGRVAPAGSALFLGYGSTLRAIRESGLPARFGRVGDVVHKAGGVTCVVGCADIDPLNLNRAVAVLAVGSNGIIDIGRLRLPGGRVDECLQAANVDLLTRTTLSSLRRAHLVVVNFGESAVLDSIKLHLSDSAYQTHRRSMLRRLDKLVGSLLDAQRRNLCGAVVLASFSVPKNGYWNRLTPIFVWSRESKHRLLTSNTTRTTGLLAASDFPDLVESLLRPPFLRPSFSLCNGSLETIRRLDARVYVNHTLLLPLGWVFAGTAALCFTIGSLAAAFRLRVKPIVRSMLLVGLLACLAAPLAMLLVVLGPPTVWLTGVLTVAVAISAALLLRIACGRAAVPVLFGVTALVIVVDALTGCGLCKFALPSSFQLEGYRYYGIGNEYAAVLVCVCAVTLLFARPSVRGKSAIALGAVVAALLGFGALGSNLGGAAAAVVTFGLMHFAFRDGQIRFRRVVCVFCAAIVTVGVLAIADWALFGDLSSHGGRLVAAALSHSYGYREPVVGGFRGIVLLAMRKCLMNLNIASSEHAQDAYLVFAPFVALWFWKVRPELNRIVAPDARFDAGLKALVVGAATAFVLNDSGIVMAGIMLGMTAAALLYTFLDKSCYAENRSS
ncbi:MAG: hypothetical protein QHI38_11810 [Armatimonadota bacterium]|nr:hypothetical protein [Armatimonadota bacterium]